MYAEILAFRPFFGPVRAPIAFPTDFYRLYSPIFFCAPSVGAEISIAKSVASSISVARISRLFSFSSIRFRLFEGRACSNLAADVFSKPYACDFRSNSVRLQTERAVYINIFTSFSRNS